MIWRIGGLKPSMPVRWDLIESADFSRLSLMSQMEKKTLLAPDESVRSTRVKWNL
jgi:hypothetical protein